MNTSEKSTFNQEKELEQIKELTKSLIDKANFLLSKGSLNKQSQLTYYREGDQEYVRAVRSYPGRVNADFSMYLRLTKKDNGIMITPEGYNSATYLFIDEVTNQARTTLLGDDKRYGSNEQMIELLSSMNKLLDKYVSLEPKNDQEVKSLTIDVIIPKNNGYYSQPNQIIRVVDHLQKFDPSAELLKTDDLGRYQLKVGDISKTDILKGILRQHYGFEV